MTDPGRFAWQEGDVRFLNGTWWREDAIAPTEYDDLSILAIADKARGRTVEFDWCFVREDLLRLWRVAFEWGSVDQGKFKYFDCQVVTAISEALGEANSVFNLNLPTKIGGVTSEVKCVRDGDDFRLQGHAVFAVLYGFCSAKIGQDPIDVARLGPTTLEILDGAIEQLGWDPRRLRESPLLPRIESVLYGFGDIGETSTVAVADRPAIDVAVHFDGPFSAFDGGIDRCLFSEDIAVRNGIYLWTIPVDGEERVHYVGQTTQGFGTRLSQHLASVLSGQSPAYDLDALSAGEYRWALAYDKDWPESLPAFLRDYEKLAPHIAGFMRLTRFHVAALPADKVLLNRVEGAIGRYYMAHARAELRDFLVPGQRVPAAVLSVEPIHLVVTSEAPIAGLPDELRA